MGTREMPGFFAKRELLYAQQPNAAALSAQGRQVLEAGLLESALEAFVKAKDAAGIGQVAAAARASGDAFAYEAAHRALGKAPSPAEWVEVGETALAAGLLWFAYRGFEKADNQAGLERTRKAMHDAGISSVAEAH